MNETWDWSADLPPEGVVANHSDVIPMNISKMFAGECDIFSLHEYQEARLEGCCTPAARSSFQRPNFPPARSLADQPYANRCWKAPRTKLLQTLKKTLCLLSEFVVRQTSRIVPDEAPRLSILDVAKSAVSNGGKLSKSAACMPELAPAIQWMTNQGILHHGTVGSEYVSVETVLRAPTTCADGSMSRIAIMKYLADQGWQATEGGRTASISGKQFNQAGFLEYFRLLKEHHGRVQQYDEAYSFRHVQSKAYYDAMLTAFDVRAQTTET